MDSKNSFDVGMTISSIPKIKNVGKEQSITIIVDHHFDRFQKKMIKVLLLLTILKSSRIIYNSYYEE